MEVLFYLWGGDVVGADISKEAISYAKNKYISKNLHFIISNAEKLPFKDRNFDIILGFEMIEHLTNPQKFIEEAYRVLKKGGLLIISTPNKSLFSPNISPLIKYHIREFTLEEFTLLLNKFDHTLFGQHLIFKRALSINSLIALLSNYSDIVFWKRICGIMITLSNKFFFTFERKGCFKSSEFGDRIPGVYIALCKKK